MSGFLKIHCPNRPIDNSTFECRGQMGGLSIEFLNSYDFKKPISDIRYCHKCGAFVQVTIESLNSQPALKVLSEEEQRVLNLTAIEQLFGGYVVEGKKIKKRDSNG